ncbi:ubiquitin-conjugating enzyme E2 5A-like [Momordica charantia]|uniref:E2 ubiquitin-conjugating enzyme n=1 Tax=Momordica charantia TaxID=3673 RepID=A0A6J1CDR5_MOMCH|nr:ubiquitin-conjugating enzyme E2 5A-like [Momordica charantia]XP_022138688.1 ubiquitin-conjugating enzyme E2 5A-like [Momordica charantia]
MVLSRLRRCFSSKSSSSSSYSRLRSPPPPPPLPIYHGHYRPPPIPPPRPVPIAAGAYRQPETTTGDGACGRVEEAPPRRVSIGGGSGDEEKTSAMYRIENELKAMNEESATHCSFGPVGGDIFRWEGLVIGPAHSCYEEGIFGLSIDLPSDYPSTPPQIKFQTKIFHPNIEEDGTIHIDILKENWSPALTIEKLLLSICSILSNPEAQNSINEASMMYKNEYFRFCEVAREWTKIYAMPS